LKNYRLNIPEVFKEIKGDLCSKIFKEYDQKSFNAIYKEDFFLAMVLYDDNENKYEAYKGSTHVLKDSNLKVVPHKEGYLTYKNGSTYTGSFNMGKVHSIGRMTYPALENKEDIIAFEGQFEDGEIKDGSSTGKFFYANGTTFEGDVVDSKPHGKGKLFKGDTIIYEGEFFNGKKHGKGRLVEYDTVYEGEFENGKKCGKGTISPRVGEVVEVTFTDDKLTKVKSIIPGVDDFSYFGSEDWKFYFGEVGDAPALPAGIEQILDAPCPYYQAAKLMGVEEMEKFGKDVNLFYYEFWIDKVCENKPLKVRDTHVLTLIPKTVNRLPFTPILLAQFIIKPLQGEAMCRSLLKKIQIMNDN